MVFCGISLGYRDASQPINQLVTERSTVRGDRRDAGIRVRGRTGFGIDRGSKGAADAERPSGRRRPGSFGSRPVLSCRRHSRQASPCVRHSSLAAIDSIKDTS